MQLSKLELLKKTLNFELEYKIEIGIRLKLEL